MTRRKAARPRTASDWAMVGSVLATQDSLRRARTERERERRYLEIERLDLELAAADAKQTVDEQRRNAMRKPRKPPHPVLTNATVALAVKRAFERPDVQQSLEAAKARLADGLQPVCDICATPKLAEAIDAEIAAGDAIPSIAARHNRSEKSVRRHSAHRQKVPDGEGGRIGTPPTE